MVRFSELTRRTFAKRNKLLIFLFVSFLISFSVAFLIPKEYESETVLVPEGLRYKTGSGILELAFTHGFGGQEDIINGLNFFVFHEIILSEDFLGKIKAHILLKSDPVFDNLLLQSRKNEFSDDVYHIFNRKSEMEWLRKRLEVRVDTQKGKINIKIRMPSPETCCLVLNVVLSELHDLMKGYHGEKIRQEIVFTETIYRETQQKYDSILNVWAEFKDRNQYLVRHTEQVLESQMKLEMEQYLRLLHDLILQKEILTARANSETTTFSVLQPSVIPRYPSAYPYTFLLICFSLANFLYWMITVYLPSFKSSMTKIQRTV